MNDRKLCILVCEDYYPEVATVLHDAHPRIACVAFAPFCHCPTTGWNTLDDIIQSNLDEGNTLCLLGGRCLQSIQHLLPKLDNLHMYQHIPCAKILAPDIVERYQQTGGYVLTVGEAVHCTECWKGKQANQDMLTAYFGNTTTQLVVLDTGFVADVETPIQLCAKQVGLPYSIAPIGLHFLRVFLDNIILNIRLQVEQQDSHHVMSDKQQIISDYEMVFDLISEMSQMRSESEVIDAIFNLFAMMYAPGKQAYIPYHHDTVGTVRTYPDHLTISDELQTTIVQMQDEYTWTNTGFILRITHNQEMLGILYVDDFTFSEHRDEYLNLALMLAQVCGLAITNARTYEELQTTMNELRAAMEQLSKARDAADAANRAKSEFLANMSHEIRTPLNAIIGMTALLADTTLTAEQKDFVATVSISGQALLAVVNDILDFSKIEAGKMELEIHPFNLRTCLEESLDLVSLRAAEQHLNLAYMFGKQVPEIIMGDMLRVRQILFNLLANAVKFTKAGEVVVLVDRLSTTQPHIPLAQQRPGYMLPAEPEDSSYVVLHIQVKDTGIGIPQHLMYRLFRSFSQVDAATNRKYGGTGLGLAISKRLVEMMQGAIWVESRLDEGSTFHLAFPAKIASPAEMPAPIVSYTTMDTRCLQDKRILLFSPYASNRAILADYMTQWGIQPLAVQTLEETLSALQQQPRFASIVLDLHMAHEEAVQFLQQICPFAPPEHGSIIAVVPIHQESKLLHTPQVRVDSFLSRPIKPTQLARALTHIFSQTPSGSAPTPAVATKHLSALQTAQATPHPPLRILLAEDNLFNQKFALRLLERFGYGADIAASGMEVLEALQQQQYDVILMDVQMPNMDGLEATRRIREQWSLPQQPYIIAMTANALQGDREMCLAAGMDDYVSKPVQVQELINALSRVKQKTSA